MKWVCGRTGGTLDRDSHARSKLHSVSQRRRYQSTASVRYLSLVVRAIGHAESKKVETQMKERNGGGRLTSAKPHM